MSWSARDRGQAAAGAGAIEALARGERTLLAPVGRAGRGAHGDARGRTARRRRSAALPARRVSVGGRATPAGDPARARALRPDRPRRRGRARPAALARPRPLGRSPSARRRRAGCRAGALRLPAAEGESLHQIPVGPVHAGIIEPGHFRFTASGETVVRLEERLGYVHRGVERLMMRRRSRPRGPARGPGLRRLDGRLRHRLRPRRRGRARDRGAGARAVAARADGRAGAARQPPGRHRRRLQRRRLRAHARPLRDAARARCCARPTPRSGTG